ncbi:twin-arginine translocase subunit TatC [Candidatus Woesearchaeota archaeon]|nr:twin-arginine translocase subunit TatC [Candidatus Woesearchaeota archaeon]
MPTIINHLKELRKRIISVIIFLITFFILGFIYSGFILNRIRLDFITKDIELIVTTPVEFFIAKLNIALFAAIVLVFPFLLYHLLMFLKPAMKGKEKALVLIFLPFSLFLFVFGIIFSYFLFLNVAVLFFSQLAVKASVLNLWSISKFIGFVFTSCLVFGLLFQLPVITMLLSKLNLLDAKILREKRKYFILLIFIIAALITPPDPLTQIMIALPLILLYELSIFLVGIFKKKEILG